MIQYSKIQENYRQYLIKCYEYIQDYDELYWSRYCERYDQLYDDKNYDFSYPIMYDLTTCNDYFDFID